MRHNAASLGGNAMHRLIFTTTFESPFTYLPRLVDPHHIKNLIATTLHLLQICLNTVPPLVFKMVDPNSSTKMFRKRWARPLNAWVVDTATSP